MTDIKHDNDASTEQWLRRMLSRRQAAGGGGQAITDACVDAETVAAWMDGRLGRDSVARIEAHVADCDRCRELAASMVRSEPGATALPATERHSRRWLGWLVPLTAAAAAAIVLFIVLPRDAARPQTPAPPQSADSRLKQEPANEVAPPRQLKDERVGADRPRDAEEQGRRRADLDRAATGKVASAREGAAKPSAVGESQTAQNFRPSTPPAAAVAAEPPARAETVDAIARQELRAVSGVLQILSPDPKIRWRVSASGVERTTDGGASWTPAPAGVAATITAGASPAPSVCWLVGRDGVVLLTTDGRTWTRLPFRDKTDLSAVSAADAQRATVTAADGRRFTTTDGGATWRLGSLVQETQTTPF